MNVKKNLRPIEKIKKKIFLVKKKFFLMCWKFFQADKRTYGPPNQDFLAYLNIFCPFYMKTMKIHQKYILWGTFGVVKVKIIGKFLKIINIGIWNLKSSKNIQKLLFSKKFAPNLGAVGGSTDVGDIENLQKSIFIYLNLQLLGLWVTWLIGSDRRF